MSKKSVEKQTKQRVLEKRIFIRFSVSPEVVEVLDKACALDERTRCDFARIATTRMATEICNRYATRNVGNVLNLIEDVLTQASDGQEVQK